MSDVIVIGGGLAGVTTLYALAEAGLSATLVEAADDVATGASFANGGMLTPSMSDPWNGPGVGRHLLSSLFDPRSAMRLRPGQIPDLAFWGLEFLRNSTSARHRAATRANFLLGQLSLDSTRDLVDRLGIEADTRWSGSLKIFESREAMAGPLSLAREAEPLGLQFEECDTARAISLEPALAPIADRIAGALFYPGDGIGDARVFVRQLGAACRQAGATMLTGSPVRRVVREGQQWRVEAGEHELTAATIVLAAGVATPQLAAKLGVRLPIKPAKGYSLTFEVTGDDIRRPRMPVIDDAMHAAVTPLGHRLRAAGTAEFAGFDRTVDPVRVDNLRRLTERMYPEIASRLDAQSATGWAGLRPMSADGKPFVGRSAVAGVWVNAGHGHLGWTLAAGSARLLAELMTGRKPSIDPAPFGLVDRTSA